jgi:hypothetical protein
VAGEQDANLEERKKELIVWERGNPLNRAFLVFCCRCFNLPADKSRSAIQKASLTLQTCLLQVISDTRGHVEMKYAQTAEEQDKDLEEREESGNEESDDEDEQVYNPLNLPMGPDGKPIPYWLYKLHGLNQVSNQPPLGLVLQSSYQV